MQKIIACGKAWFSLNAILTIVAGKWRLAGDPARLHLPGFAGFLQRPRVDAVNQFIGVFARCYSQSRPVLHDDRSDLIRVGGCVWVV